MNEWEKYQELVLQELQENKNNIKELQKEIIEMKIMLTSLKIKNSIYSILMGLIGGAIAILLQFLIRRI